MKHHQSPFIALRYRDFRLLWLGLLISTIGNQMQIVGLIWHTYTLTGSALSLGYIGLARFLPLLVFSFIGGTAADRFNRKTLIFFAQILMLASTAILIFTTYSHQISPLIIYLILALNSVAASFDSPSRQSMTPALVPKKHFFNAVSLNTLMRQTSLVIGPSLAGFIIAYLGVGSVYVINALTFIPIIISLMMMSNVPQSFSRTVSFSLNSFKEGLKFVKNTPIISASMVLDFFATFFASANVLMPIFATEVLNVGPKGLGFLYAAPSFGALIAGFFVSSRKHIPQQGKLLLWSVGIFGIATILFGISRSFYASLVFLAVSGAGDVISTILRSTIRQLITPDRLRGRMSGINMFFYAGGPQLGEVEAGFSAALLGAPLSVITGGIGTILVTLFVALKVPEVIKYQGEEVIV